MAVEEKRLAVLIAWKMVDQAAAIEGQSDEGERAQTYIAMYWYASVLSDADIPASDASAALALVQDVATRLERALPVDTLPGYEVHHANFGPIIANLERCAKKAV